MAAALTFLVPVLALADKGELAIGAGVVGRWPCAIGGELELRLGIGDYLALDARVGGGAKQNGGFGNAEGGLVALFDVLSWVPELRLSVGVEHDRNETLPAVHTTLGLRRFFSLDKSAALEIGVRWAPGEWQGTFGLSFLLGLMG